MKKVVVITGAAGGMGRAISTLLSESFDVIALDRTDTKLQALKSQLPSSNIDILAGDLSQSGWEAELTSLLNDRPLYAVINLAGVSCGDTVSEVSDQDWQTSFDVNVTAPMRLIRWASPFLKTQGQGRVINVGSPVGVVGARKASYSASKAALNGLTMSSARELGKHNITVNLILPGAAVTDMTSDWSPSKRQAIAEGSFLNRLMAPEDIAHCIDFLLDEKSHFITGSVIDLTAGSMVGH